MITESERKYLLDSMKSLLDKYEYNYTLHALNTIIDTWAEQKEDLIDAFKKHPNYVEGKFLIAFTQDYSREIDFDCINRFRRWIFYDAVQEMVDTLPEDINKQRISEGCSYLPELLYNFFRNLDEYICTRTISDNLAEKLSTFIPQIHPHAGEKTSRVINRICKYLNYNKHPDYNKEFARLADSLSPMTITRHTILSINPLDYLTMSFGNSWSSCHTIYKRNRRGMPNSYE